MSNSKLYVKNSSLYSKMKFMLGKVDFGKVWQEKPLDWYYDLWNKLPLLHKNFQEYFQERTYDIKTVLDLGCGAAYYPFKFPEMFKGKKYVGTDISESAIEYCEKNSPFDFFAGDFLKMDLKNEFLKRNLPTKYDLVYAHGVIDCVYDIELFLNVLLKCCKKYAYIHSCRGYHPELEHHSMNWRDEDGCYYNDISVKQVKRFLLNYGLDVDEFIIRPQPTGFGGNVHAIIEITKKSQD